MQFCVRVDDLGWTDIEVPDLAPQKKPDIGLVMAQRFHDAMQGRPYLGAVIPAMIRDDPQAQAWLASQPAGLTVALHGWNHEPRGFEHSEFWGLGLFQCRERIEWGQRLIETLTGAYTPHFVAPFNHYGGAPLIEALGLEGIEWAWGGGSLASTEPAEWATQPPIAPMGKVHFVPSWGRLYGGTRWTFGRAPILLESLPQVIDYPGMAVLTLHLPWELSRGGPEFGGVQYLVEKYGEHIISPAEFVCGSAS